MINLEEKDLTLVDSYIFTEDFENIPVNKVIVLNKDNFNKIDKIIVTNYGDRGRIFFKNVLSILQYFNNIPDINTLSIGKTIKFPDLDVLMLYYEDSNIFSENNEIVNNQLIPGINMQSILSTNKNKNSNNNNINTGNPRLSINVKEVTYNKDTGIVKY